MGNDNTYESYRTDERNSSSGNKSSSRKEYKFGPFSINAKLLGLFFIELHNVQRAAVEKDYYDTDRNVRQNCSHFRPFTE